MDCKIYNLHFKVNSTLDPAIMEDTECAIIKAYTPFFDLKVGVSLDHDVASLCFVLLLVLQMLWATFQTKNNVRSAPASSALTQVSQ